MEFHLSIVVDHRIAYSGTFTQPLELGRQQPEEPEPFQLQQTGEIPRLIVAPAGDVGISRRQLRIDPLEKGRVELTNLSSSAAVQLLARPVLGPGQKTTVEIPFSAAIGNRLFLNISAEENRSPLRELPEATILPGHGLRQRRVEVESPARGVRKDSELLVQSLQTVMDLFLSARNQKELFHSAIDGAMSLIGFDIVRVLNLRNEIWQEAEARALTTLKFPVVAPSQHVLENVRQRKRTFWETEIDSPDSASLTHVTAVVGAPIMNADGEVIGALYGDRRREVLHATADEIMPLDARLMELLACGIASGLARLQHQERAEQMRLQFAQFFTPELAAELEENPELLQGQDADVSLLFCDIRGFSRISERIGATETFHWIHDMMDMLSDCVLRHNGVLVDYIGDELMAMWGAPRSQQNHAEGACRAALAMMEALPILNSRWEHRIGEPVELAIGINSGIVKVGNAGSRHKFKYSPLGNAVNLASRVVGINRHLKTSILMTGTTSRQLPDDLIRRKLCDVAVVNVDEPIELFELMTQPVPEELLRDYELSRQAFDRREFRTAAHLTARLLEAFPEDGAALVLLSRSVQAMMENSSSDSRVWQLTEK